MCVCVCVCACVCVCVCVNKRDVENVGNNSRKQAMVCKCCVVDCRSNYAGEERTTVFSFPKEESLRKIWIRFVNRKELGSPRKRIYQDDQYQSFMNNDSINKLSDIEEK